MTSPVLKRKQEGSLDIVYEDDHLFIVLPEKPACKGHLKVYSQKPVRFVHELEQREFFFTAASLAATALFELMGAQGTNIIINNGPFEGGNVHLVADVMARFEGDGLDFQWQPTQLPDTEMQSAEERIRDKTFYIGKEQPEEEPKVVEEGPAPVTESSDGKNYLLRRLRRIP